MGAASSKDERRVAVRRAEERQIAALSPIDSLKTSMRSLVEKNMYSDLIVICCDDRFPVHRAIVCLRSRWFEINCYEIAQIEGGYRLPQTIDLGHSEQPHVMAAMLAYLYILDYPDGEPELVFGVPETPGTDILWRDQQAELSHEYSSTLRTEGKRKTDTEEEGSMSDTCSSEFALIKEEDETPKTSLNGTVKLAPAHVFSPPPVEEPTDTPSPTSSVIQEDPCHRPSPLTLHTQMYKAGIRYGIPCLAAHAFAKFSNRLRGAAIETDELLEAAQEAYTIGQWDDESKMDPAVFGTMRQSLIHILRRRWSSVRTREEFENVVLQRPEFGRDMMRVL